MRLGERHTYPWDGVTTAVDVAAGSRISGGRVVAFGVIGLVARKRDTSYLRVEGPEFVWELPLRPDAIDSTRQAVARFAVGSGATRPRLRHRTERHLTH